MDDKLGADFQIAIKMLNAHVLDLQATVVFQGAKLSALDSLLLGLLIRPEHNVEAQQRLRNSIDSLVQERVNDYLAKMSDDNPSLVSRLKLIVDEAYSHNSEPPPVP
jgi:hypothetical protein